MLLFIVGHSDSHDQAAIWMHIAVYYRLTISLKSHVPVVGEGWGGGGVWEGSGTLGVMGVETAWKTVQETRELEQG